MASSALDACVHCGFCLPSCPTYRLWGNEADSPRGRILLMGLLASGSAEPAEVAPHLDACLGCLACLDACPSGVAYDEAIEEARATLEEQIERPAAERFLRAAVFAVFPYRERLRLAVRAGVLARRLGVAALARRARGHATGPVATYLGLLADLDELLPDHPPAPRWRGRRQTEDRVVAAEGERRLRVGTLTGCVQSVLFEPVNEATLRVLAAEGCEVVVPAAQGCCGALGLHAGRPEEAKRSARALVDAFDDELDAVVVNSAGCGSAMKDYGRLLADEPGYAERAAAFAAKVRDVHELLAGLEPRARRHPIDLEVAYHDACHLAHAQQITSEPRRLLRSIPGLELKEVPTGASCCGSAGLYNLFEPETANELGRQKAAAVRSTGAPVVAAANPGCLLQLDRHLGGTSRALHPIELLDASIRGATLEELGLR